MSIFEFLRYSDTELTNEAALLRLPEPVIALYWDKVHDPEREEGITHYHMCRRLARWARFGETATEKEYVRERFYQALKEVEPCDGPV